VGVTPLAAMVTTGAGSRGCEGSRRSLDPSVKVDPQLARREARPSKLEARRTEDKGIKILATIVDPRSPRRQICRTPTDGGP
jgi:hypothetical protein